MANRTPKFETRQIDIYQRDAYKNGNIKVALLRINLPKEIFKRDLTGKRGNHIVK